MGYSTTEHHRNGVSRFESVWQLFNQAVIFLQRFNTTFATVAILYTLNSLYSGNSPSKRCDVAYLVLQAHFADCFTVFCVIALCLWCVDYKANFFVHNTAGQGTLTLEALTQPFCGFLSKALSTRNQVYYIRTAGTNLIYNFALNSIAIVEICCSLSAHKSEAKVFQ